MTLIIEISDTEHRRSKSLPNTQSFHPMTTLEVILSWYHFISQSILLYHFFMSYLFYLWNSQLSDTSLSISLCLFHYYYFIKLFFTILVHLSIYLSLTPSIYHSVSATLSQFVYHSIYHLLPLFSSHYRVTGSWVTSHLI